MRQPVERKSAMHRMRGGIAITAALWLMVIITALGAVDVGHVWWERRHLQGVADMLALAGAQRLDVTCTGDPTALTQIATLNGYSGGFTASCGRFDTSSNTFTPAASPDDPTINAVNVEINSNINYWFMPMIGKTGQGIDVASTSRVVNIGAYTLGTTLATVQSGNSVLLNALLGQLLKSSVNLDLVSYTALANAQVKLGDLAAQINSNQANDIVQMLGQSPTLQTLIAAVDAALTVPASDPSRAALTQIAGAASAGQGGKTVPMNGANGAGLLNIGLENVNAATNVTVDALDAIMVAAMIANTNSSNTVSPITLDASLLPSLPGITKSAVQLSLGQPPVLAIGEAGTLSAQARSQQVQLLVQLSVNVGGGGLLPSIIAVSLPVLVSVAPATASLSQTKCGAGASDSSSTIGVTPGIASICISDNAPNIFKGTATACSSTVTLVTLLGVPTVTGLGGSLQLSPGNQQTVSFSGVGTQISQPNPFSVNSNAVGSDLATALSTKGNSLIGNLTGNLTVYLAGIPISLNTLGLGPAVQNIINAVTQLLTPALNSILVQVLGLLGTQVGVATINDLSLTCGNVQLVQ